MDKRAKQTPHEIKCTGGKLVSKKTLTSFVIRAL